MQQTISSAPSLQPRTAEQGLTSAQAELRLATIGPNEPTPVQRTALLRQLLIFLTDPFVVTLLIASVVAGVLGEVVNAIIIAVMVLLSIALNFIQTARSQQAADRLAGSIDELAAAARRFFSGLAPHPVLLPIAS
jgi:P-type Mg2+ transporter